MSVTFIYGRGMDPYPRDAYPHVPDLRAAADYVLDVVNGSNDGDWFVDDESPSPRGDTYLIGGDGDGVATLHLDALGRDKDNGALITLMVNEAIRIGMILDQAATDIKKRGVDAHATPTEQHLIVLAEGILRHRAAAIQRRDG